MNFCRATVELQPACTGSWINISGDAASVAVDGGEISSAEQNVFGSKFPIVAAGKPGSIDVTVTAVYTEVPSGVADIIRTAYETGACDQTLCLRWSPGGGDVGDLLYTTVSGFLTSHPYVGGDANAADISLVTLTVKCQRIETTTIV
jgi:hypothetical protein